jgi:hypothetical protein
MTDIVDIICCLMIINSKHVGGGIWLRFRSKNESFVKCQLRRIGVVDQTWVRQVAEDNYTYCGTKRTVTKGVLTESFRVTQRLAVWCC